MREFDHQIAYWNRVGKHKSFAHPVNFERLTGLLPIDSCVVDFGCGYGRVLTLLHQHGYSNLIGVDPAPAMIAAAREQLPQISFYEDPLNLALPDASVDAVLLFAVLTCIPGDPAQRAIIREISRILRPGGLLYISDLWLQTDDRNRRRYKEGQVKYGLYGVFDLPEGVTLRHHDRRWIETLTATYTPLALDEISVPTMNGNLANGFQWFGRKQQAS